MTREQVLINYIEFLLSDFDPKNGSLYWRGECVIKRYGDKRYGGSRIDISAEVNRHLDNMFLGKKSSRSGNMWCEQDELIKRIMSKY